jgi:hypothetical protein
MPLIHWELRPNWVCFVILAFGPLAPGPDPCSLTIWLCSAADAVSGAASGGFARRRFSPVRPRVRKLVDS